MPVLYCRPVNNLANRMMSIVLAYRLAKLWSYEFCLIWDWGPETLFANAYEDLFVCDFPVLRDFSHQSHELHMPARNDNGRHFYRQPDAGQDVFLSGWGHLTLCEADSHLSPQEITRQLQACFAALFVPTQPVTQVCENLGYRDQRFDFGIHVRRGAPEFDRISGNDQLLQIALDIVKQGDFKSFFVASTEPASADYFGMKLRAHGEVFVSRGYNNEPSFRNHALAIYDLLFFSRCREIMKTGATTYSSLAALMGGATLNTVNEQGGCIKHPALYSVGAGL